MASGSYRIGPRLASTRVVDQHAAVRTGARGFRRDVVAFSLRGEEPAAAFAETAAAFASLGHPHVLAVDDVCEDRGRVWVVARPLSGAPLAHLLDVPASRARALRVDVVVGLVRRVAEAAHALSVLAGGAPLGGLSADALWLERSGAPVLLPAVRAARGAALDPVLSRVAPPESRDGVPLGPTADVYALALLLWDLLCVGRARGASAAGESTTETPFSGDRGLAELVLRALAPCPEERPPHLLAFRDELVAFTTAGEAEEPVTVALENAEDAPESDPRTLELGTFASAESAPPPGTRPALRTMPAPVRILREPVAVRTTVPVEQEPQARVPRCISPHLRVIGQGNAPPALDLDPQSNRWIVGRGRSADLVVLDLDMSREHFEIVRGADRQFRIFDLASKNGSFVNGTRADDLVLRPGDRLRAGNTEFRFEA